MDRAERLEHNFDIEPEEGVKLPFQPESSDAPEEPGQPEVQAESPDVENVEPDEEGQDEAQDVDPNWRMSSFDFAEATGITAREVYENVEFKTRGGPKSAKQLVEGYESMLTQQDQWNEERQQLQERAQNANYGAISQPLSPKAQRLMIQAELLEEQRNRIQWDQIPEGQRADLKIDYDHQVRAIMRQAQDEQQQYLSEQDKQRRQFEVDVHRETLRLIPEWNARDIYDTEVPAIKTMLRSEGFPEEQIEAIAMDPRSMSFVRKAWNAIRGTEEVRKGAKKIRKLSKTLSPSAKRPGRSNRLADVGKRVRQAQTKQERQKARLEANFER